MAERLTLVRHGETEWSRSGRHTGRTDLPLTELGRDQARALRRHLAGRRFSLVLTSPLMRARQTAALAGFPDARVVEDLREWDYGDYEGLTTAEIRLSVPGWTVWSHPCPGGESLTSVAERADAVLALAADAVGDVLAFGHGHALRGLASRWCGVDPAFGRLLALDPASVSELAHEREAPVVLTWNLHGFEA